MTINIVQARNNLKSFDFEGLFIDELGWDRHNTRIEIELPGMYVSLKGIAHKRGFVAYHCVLDEFPDYQMRRKIEQQVVKVTREHIIIFTDTTRRTQIWQWVKREPSKPTACREHYFRVEQSGDALLQKLQTIAFSLEEEDKLTLTDVTTRTKQSFDVERITKRFYDRFKDEHDKFLKFIMGIEEQTDREWYASVMLNRLMFIYFIQRKGFLDGDPHYLRNKLNDVQKQHGSDRFYSFYRYFLLKLFHEGLGKKARSKELDVILGKIPYLNGGLFDIHTVEQKYPNIQIPDEAFEHIFDYFDQYQWHLDERPLRADNEINPDVLGYIFEKYINQKQMGAYYTKEDITEYISKSTILPFLFNAAKTHCMIAFENPEGSTIWDALAINPERYLFPAIRHGVIRQNGTVVSETELPDFVQTGMKNPEARIFENRYNLHQALSEDPFRLITETWREYVYRRNHCLDIIGKMKRGDINDINDLVTYNLDIRQFAQDVIDNSEGPELIRAFWTVIEKVTILDPTCGSGAFLFAALNILEPLYEACLNRMESFIEDDLQINDKKIEKFTDFKALLNRVDIHPNRPYFIFKSIILNNLYGVDIMEEAIEICRLRLFLKLAAQVEPEPSKENLGIEPLPDIDFNIRAGNTLVGYVSMDEVRNAMASKLDVDDAMVRFKTATEGVDKSYKRFRALQTENQIDTEELVRAKKVLHEQLNALSSELSRCLAVQYKVPTNHLQDWLISHTPFHWLVEYYGIMEQNGFDVIIGNPPYIEYCKVKDNYTVINYSTLPCGNLYAYIMQRSISLLNKKGIFGMIVPISSVSSERTEILRKFMRDAGTNYVSSYDTRPSKLFDVDQKLTIWVHFNTPVHNVFSTILHHWKPDERERLFQKIVYTDISSITNTRYFYKIPSSSILHAFEKMLMPLNTPFEKFTQSYKSKHLIYYQESARYWIKAAIGLPYYSKDGVINAPAHGRFLYYETTQKNSSAFAVLSSNLFYLWFAAICDGFHLTDAAVTQFPIPSPLFENRELISLGIKLDEELRKCAKRTTIKLRAGITIEYDEYKSGDAKYLMDEVDEILANEYKFSEIELDEIVNYDIKYRLNGEGDNNDE